MASAVVDSLPAVSAPIVVRDTMSATELTHKASDAYLLDIIGAQAAQLVAAEEAAEAHRLATDLTTLFPLHLGYADSLRIAETLRRQHHTSALCLPLLYQPASPLHLPALSYEAEVSAKASHASLQKAANGSPASLQESLFSSALPLPSLAKDPRAEARRYLTRHHADLYTGVADSSKVEHDLPSERSKSLYELYVPEKSLVKDTEADRRERLNAIKNKNNPWYKELSTLLQFTQNYVSRNWYEGGNSAFSMYASAKGKILYDDKKRITWENTAEWVEGFSTVSGDSLRKVNSTDDLFRLYSKMGVKVAKKLYISGSAELRTQLFPTYNSNANTIKTGPFTPVRFNLAIGVDWKPVTGLSVVLSPAAYKMVYAADTVRSDYPSYGIEKGKKVLNQIGSSVRVEWKWKPLREVQLETNFYTYTNYRSVELDLEVSCDFIINRFLSARVMLHPRYDSAHKTTRGDDSEPKARMQFKELISIGFAHKFY